MMWVWLAFIVVLFYFLFWRPQSKQVKDHRKLVDSIQAGNIIVKGLDRLDDMQVFEKDHNDFVTEIDRAAETKIIHTIRKAYPDHAIHAEESGETGENDIVWIIDPLDGTTNYMHGFTHFAVSIAICEKGKIEHAVVYDPIRGDLFTGSRGQGSHLNDRRMRVSDRKSLDGCLIGTGFPFRDHEHLHAYLETFKSLFTKASDIRRAGSAVLDLTYVAAGRLDGFWESGLKEWDMAAGALLVREAGGFVADFTGGENFLKQGHIVAANPKVFKAMLQVIQPAAKSLTK